jgi:hypothetical protein
MPVETTVSNYRLNHTPAPERANFDRPTPSRSARWVEPFQAVTLGPAETVRTTEHRDDELEQALVLTNSSVTGAIVAPRATSGGRQRADDQARHLDPAARGFPVWARPGPGGGYVVDKATTLPPVNFTDAEVAGLAAAVAAHRGQPFDGYARAALVKALSVMDTPARERATMTNHRIWIDYTEPPSDARTRHTIERALHEQRVLIVDYRDRHDRQTERRIDPVALARTAGLWYLVGNCRTREAIRWFRLDRMTSARLTTEPSATIPVEDIGTPPATAKATADF